MNTGSGQVGELHWFACDFCSHYRDQGGCQPLDDDKDILETEVDDDAIYCTKYREAKP